MSIENKLKKGDIIKRFELNKEIDFKYIIKSVTKTQAKTSCGTRFKIDLNYNTTKPSEKCIAEATKIGYSNYQRYFLIKND